MPFVSCTSAVPSLNLLLQVHLFGASTLCTSFNTTALRSAADWMAVLEYIATLFGDGQAWDGPNLPHH